jgi:hypothetical protein
MLSSSKFIKDLRMGERNLRSFLIIFGTGMRVIVNEVRAVIFKLPYVRS